MQKPTRLNVVALALYANAAVLLAILWVLAGRQNPSSEAFAQVSQPAQPPIAGGQGVYVMPCQLHANVWGCYVLDTNHQILCTYEYRAGERTLVLTAARDIRYDAQLKNFNTFPAWYDVQSLVRQQENHRPSSDSESPQEKRP